ncbi:MAG: ubiquitin-conjugating enzyme E2 Ze [Chrysothrix sp. TS-e1954]|nr:MAG: ubiquitin-conjugating enzyme E2 Ze [Chrysothrix sp. TS-e1954]
MATSLAVKRMLRERTHLTAPTTTSNSSPQYHVSFPTDNLLTCTAYIAGPAETLYAHKFLKLRIDIPHDYPLVPPKCTYIQHGAGRIHPNFYEDGKVCLSILGTWPGEPWAQSMTVESVLITIQSLLDNTPYTHEPHKSDSKPYNDFVRYTTWSTNLLGYLRNETDAASRAFLEDHLRRRGGEMVGELTRQAGANVREFFSSPYRGATQIRPEYGVILGELEARMKLLSPLAVKAPEVESVEQPAANASTAQQKGTIERQPREVRTQAAVVPAKISTLASTSASSKASKAAALKEPHGRKRKLEVIDLT